MRLWTSRFQDTGKLPHVLWDGERSGRLGDLAQRRRELRQYELESYAAIGRRVCETLEQGTWSHVDLGHDVLARFVRVIEVTTPAYPELIE